MASSYYRSYKAVYHVLLHRNMAHLSRHPKKINVNLPCVYTLSVNRTYDLSSGTKRLLGLLSASRRSLTYNGLRAIA